METTIFIKASDRKIHEAFDAVEQNGYLLDIRRITPTDCKSIWECIVRHNNKANFENFATYDLKDAQKIQFNSLSEVGKDNALAEKPSAKDFI